MLTVKFAIQNPCVMVKSLLSNTSTLVVKLPDYLILPEYHDKIRIRKTIIRTISQLLQTKTLEMLYIGWKPIDHLDYFDPIADPDSCTIVSLNVIHSYGKICDFNTPQFILLKRFKRELQNNNEHILIDSTKEVNGKMQRSIEVYMNSRNSPKGARENYMYSVPSGSGKAPQVYQ
jgi:hypothetical protein